MKKAKTIVLLFQGGKTAITEPKDYDEFDINIEHETIYKYEEGEIVNLKYASSIEFTINNNKVIVEPDYVVINEEVMLFDQIKENNIYAIEVKYDDGTVDTYEVPGDWDDDNGKNKNQRTFEENDKLRVVIMDFDKLES